MGRRNCPEDVEKIFLTLAGTFGQPSVQVIFTKVILQVAGRGQKNFLSPREFYLRVN
jgi:hypothetical protein